MNYCKTHNEPINIITDRYGKMCIKCYSNQLRFNAEKKKITKEVLKDRGWSKTI